MAHDSWPNTLHRQDGAEQVLYTKKVVADYTDRITADVTAEYFTQRGSHS